MLLFCLNLVKFGYILTVRCNNRVCNASGIYTFIVQAFVASPCHFNALFRRGFGMAYRGRGQELTNIVRHTIRATREWRIIRRTGLLNLGMQRVT